MSGGTVRVRIAVAVDADGSYLAFGGEHNPDAYWASKAFRGQEEASGPTPVHTVFVEADVPLPTPTTIEGKVPQ